MKTADSEKDSIEWMLEFWEKDLSSEEAERVVVRIQHEAKRKGAEEMREECAMQADLAPQKWVADAIRNLELPGDEEKP